MLNIQDFTLPVKIKYTDTKTQKTHHHKINRTAQNLKLLKYELREIHKSSITSISLLGINLLSLKGIINHFIKKKGLVYIGNCFIVST